MPSSSLYILVGVPFIYFVKFATPALSVCPLPASKDHGPSAHLYQACRAEMGNFLRFYFGTSEPFDFDNPVVTYLPAYFIDRMF